MFKEGICSAIFRFLPDSLSPDGVPYTKVCEHSFDYVPANSKEKRRYWRRCINTLGKNDCPICSKFWEYKNSAFESDKKEATKYNRKEKYMCNIYIIKHQARPEDEGKIFLFDCSPVIQKYKKQLFPTDADKAHPKYKDFIPYDFDEGANFYLTSIAQGTFANGTPIPNYDKGGSDFLDQSAFLGGDDNKIEEVMKGVYSLTEFREESSFPTNEEVIKIVGHMFGMSTMESSEQEDNSDDSTDNSNFFGSDDDIPNFDAPITPSENSPQNENSEASSGSGDEDDDSAFFENLNK